MTPDELKKMDPLSKLSQEKQAEVISELIGSFGADHSKPHADKIDALVARTLRKRPILCTIPDSSGRLPIWNAVTHNLPRTLKTLVDLDQSPRHNQRLIASYSKSREPVRFVINELVKSMSSSDLSTQSVAMRTMHTLIPILTHEDNRKVAPYFMSEIVNGGNLKVLQTLIDEGYDLLTPVDVDPFPDPPSQKFVEACFGALLWNQSLDLIGFLKLKGMKYTRHLFELLKGIQLLELKPIERDVLQQFIITVDSLVSQRFLKLEKFICGVNMLRAYGIDIRDSMFENNYSPERLLERCSEDTQAHRRFLRERPPLEPTRPSQHTYLMREATQPPVANVGDSRETHHRINFTH